MFKDTYFLDPKEALKVAQQQNKSQNGYKLQVCYYNGEKLDSNLPNLIHLPIENLARSLALGVHRLPEVLSFDGMDISQELKEEIETYFKFAMGEAKVAREELNKHYLNSLKNAKLDFNEELRVYLFAHNSTQVMQHVSRAIADTFKDMGYNVLFDFDYGTRDVTCHKILKEFNPHIIININHMNNHILGKDVFNFVWFQDPMPFLLNPAPYKKRERDYVYALLEMFAKMLERKGIPSQLQGFCVNTKVYKTNSAIKREKKIVFIGSSYLKNIPYTKEIKQAVSEIEKRFLSGESLGDDFAKEITYKYKLKADFVSARLIPYVVRDIGLLELLKVKNDYILEIYGWGWEAYEEIKPYYKGALKYGKEIADVYSSATYAFAPHQQYTLQQRVFEASACGAIPIVYDCRDISKEEDYGTSMCYYKTTKDLEKILQSDIPQKDFDRLLLEHTYASFVQKILKIVEENK